MPELISKIQYNTCEKGEFFDERQRSLEETIYLIKTFPWDEQRGSDIQLSGPGVVIQNSRGEYLKVALYFNGKYSCYFLDKGNHLYEYHTPELLKAYKLVEGFFSDVLDLSAFDKHFFNIGNRAHLITQEFVYQVSPIKEYLRMGTLLILLILEIFIFSISLFVKDIPVVVSILFSCFICIFGLTMAMMVKVYLKTKKMAIQISKSKDEFSFNDGTGWAEYLKSDITEINIYGRTSGRNRQILTIIKLALKSGGEIKFSGMLIDPVDVMMKMPEHIPRNYFEQNSVLKKVFGNIKLSQHNLTNSNKRSFHPSYLR